MKFLNKKEQVIDLEITPYGKSLLSMGRFKPEYYAFFDDDILYDSQYAGITEHQNSASVRIKEAPELETQAYFYSAEKQVKEATAFHRLTKQEKKRAKAYGQLFGGIMDITNQDYVQDDGVTIGTIPDKEFDRIPIGNSSLNSSYAPAWGVNVISGIISSSSETTSDLNLQIPQLNITGSMYKFTLTDGGEFGTDGNFYEFDDDSSLSINSPLKGKFLNILEDSVILEIDEANTSYDWENFDIEIFEIEKVTFKEAKPVGLPTGSATVNKEFLRPLFFKKDVGLIQNGILLDPDELLANDSPITPDFAEYYFEISVDDHIDKDLLCERAINKPAGLFSRKALNCDEERKLGEISIEHLYDPDEGECE